MTFKTTLFKLLSANTSKITVDGYEIETVCDYGLDANGAPVQRCNCDEIDWYFADQEVVVNDEGACTAMTAPGDWDCGDASFESTLEFLVARPIEECDL